MSPPISRIGLTIVAAATTWALVASAAESLDNPTIMSRQPLDGASSVSGQISPKAGFPAHVYTASKDGMARVMIETANINKTDNDGVAWRPYMRVLSQSNEQRNGEAWSTNGFRHGTTADGELVFRVRAGEKFTVIATLAKHIESSSRETVDYKIAVKE
jgi:hypothetical protein